MIIADIGTTYSKILDTTQAGAVPRIMPSKDLGQRFHADMTTGHRGKKVGTRYINELTALARGGQALIRQPDFLLLDCGSRDIKYISYRDNTLADMGWNAECGASMGFSIELLLKYYGLSPTQLPLPAGPFSVTCGVLGMSSIFDAVISGCSEAEAVASYVKGIALNAFRFAGSPDHLYLSGGMCDLPLFVTSLPCDVTSLGRFVLLHGLSSMAEFG